MKSFEVRFWKKVEKTSHCWIWKGSIAKSGYGITCRNGEQLNSHRASWIIKNGDIPEGLCVLHNCLPKRDNRSCVNPKHLWLGTAKENVIDMLNKGGIHYARGEKTGNSKMIPRNVIKIRKEWPNRKSSKEEFYRQWVARLNVCRETIKTIVHRKSWTHLP